MSSTSGSWGSPTSPASTSRGARPPARRGVLSPPAPGGEPPAFAAPRGARALAGDLAVVHVPKTIDNDLPLPPEVPTYGYTTAVNLGKDLVQHLMGDAATTGKWFFVTVMGRHAGHLALGIAGAAAATLAVIGEEFPE